MQSGLRSLYGSIRCGDWERALNLFPLVVFDFSRRPTTLRPSDTAAVASRPSPSSEEGDKPGGNVLSELMSLCRANGRNSEALQVFSVALETGLHCCAEAERQGMESMQALRGVDNAISMVRSHMLTESSLALTHESGDQSGRRGSVLGDSIASGDDSAWSQSLRLLFLLQANCAPTAPSPAVQIPIAPCHTTPPTTSSLGSDNLEEVANSYCFAVASKILAATTAREKMEIVSAELSTICRQSPPPKDGALPVYTLDFVRCLAAVVLDHAAAFAAREEDAYSPVLDAAVSGRLAAFDDLFFGLVASWGRHFVFAGLQKGGSSTAHRPRSTYYRFAGNAGSRLGPPTSPPSSHILVPVASGRPPAVLAPYSHGVGHPYLPSHLAAEQRLEYLFGSLSRSHGSCARATRTFVVLDVDFILAPQFISLIAEVGSQCEPKKPRRSGAPMDVWGVSHNRNAELVVTFSTLLALLERAMSDPLAKQRLDQLVRARTSFSSQAANASAAVRYHTGSRPTIRRRFSALLDLLPDDLKDELVDNHQAGCTLPDTSTTQQPGCGGVTLLGLQEEVLLSQMCASSDDKVRATRFHKQQHPLKDCPVEAEQRTQRLVAAARVISNIVAEQCLQPNRHRGSPSSSVDAILRSIGLGHLSQIGYDGGGDILICDDGSSEGGTACNVVVGALAGGAVARACNNVGVRVV